MLRRSTSDRGRGISNLARRLFERFSMSKCEEGERNLFKQQRFVTFWKLQIKLLSILSTAFIQTQFHIKNFIFSWMWEVYNICDETCIVEIQKIKIKKRLSKLFTRQKASTQASSFKYEFNSEARFKNISSCSLNFKNAKLIIYVLSVSWWMNFRKSQNPDSRENLSLKILKISTKYSSE